jgi:hypothetical protein
MPAANSREPGINFEIKDQYKFKKGHQIDSISIQRIADSTSLLCLVAYNGSKLMQVMIGVDSSKETRLFRKLPHNMFFKNKARHALPITQANNSNKTNILVLDESNQLLLFQVGASKADRLLSGNKIDVAPLDKTASTLEMIKLPAGRILIVAQE